MLHPRQIIQRHIAPFFPKKRTICRRVNTSQTVGQYVAGIADQAFEVGQYDGGEMAFGFLSIPLELRHIAPVQNCHPQRTLYMAIINVPSFT